MEPSLTGKSCANERNESSLSNCRVQPALSIKEGRVGFRKKPFLMGKSGANERNESSLSNCRVQPALSKKKEGLILEQR